LVGKFNVYGKDRVLNAIASGNDDLFFITSNTANNVRRYINAALSDQRGAQVGASPAAQGPIEQTGGRGSVTPMNKPAYIRHDPQALLAKYMKHPNFARDFRGSPSLAQRKYNIPQDEFAAMINEGVDASGNSIFFDHTVMQQVRDWEARNLPPFSTQEQRNRNAFQYGLNQKVDPNKPNPAPNLKPAYPKGPGKPSTTNASPTSAGGSKFTVDGSSNAPNMTIASVSSKLPKGSNPMFVASAIRSNPALAAQYGLTSSEAKMLMQYYAE